MARFAGFPETVVLFGALRAFAPGLVLGLSTPGSCAAEHPCCLLRNPTFVPKLPPDVQKLPPGFGASRYRPWKPCGNPTDVAELPPVLPKLPPGFGASRYRPLKPCGNPTDVAKLPPDVPKLPPGVGASRYRPLKPCGNPGAGDSDSSGFAPLPRPPCKVSAHSATRCALSSIAGLSCLAICTWDLKFEYQFVNFKFNLLSESN